MAEASSVWRVVRLPKVREIAIPGDGSLRGFVCGVCGETHMSGVRPHSKWQVRAVLRRMRRAVSPIVATILLVAITIGLAVVLYILLIAYAK